MRVHTIHHRHNGSLSYLPLINTTHSHKTTFDIVLPPSLYRWSDLLYCISLKSCMFSADGSIPRVLESQHNKLLSISDSTHHMLIHFSQQPVFLSVHPVSQDILPRFQNTGRDGDVTFVLDMGCHNATALLQKVWCKVTAYFGDTIHCFSPHLCRRIYLLTI